jgi:hypothetical protein
VAESRYFDPSQPQTLQIATMLLYFEAGLGLFYGVFGSFSLLALLFIAAYAAAAYGMANEKKWGYGLGLGATSLRLLLLLVRIVGVGGFLAFALLPTGAVIELIIAGAMVALLAHEQSREYQRIWFS